MTHSPQQPLDELQALCARQFERLDEIATALANGAYYADDPECHPLYPQAVAARQILEKAFTSLHREIQRLREHISEHITFAETRIQDGIGCGSTVWRLALEDIAKENRAALSPQENKDDR